MQYLSTIRAFPHAAQYGNFFFFLLNELKRKTFYDTFAGQEKLRECRSGFLREREREYFENTSTRRATVFESALKASRFRSPHGNQSILYQVMIRFAETIATCLFLKVRKVKSGSFFQDEPTWEINCGGSEVRSHTGKKSDPRVARKRENCKGTVSPLTRLYR